MEQIIASTIVSTNIISDKLVAILPYLAGGFGIVLLGILLGVGFKKLFIFVFRRSVMRHISDYFGFNKVTKKLNLQMSVSEIFGEILKWYVISFAVLVAAKVIGLEGTTEILDKIVSYIPNVILAIIILFFGIRTADTVYSMILGAITLSRSNISHMIALVAKISLLIFTILLALAELGLSADIVNIIFIGFVATISLASGLAFGLGGQSVAREVLEELKENVNSKQKNSKK